jgi:N-acetylglucosaminyldiphosphoundecaprenol N-acetyl-beta-D-mannosaminyltransferase
MLNLGKGNILGVLIDAVDYEGAVDIVVRAAKEKKPAAVSALAVHGLMTGVLDREQRFRLNQFDLLVPDGQPVRWVLNALYGKKLPDRVYGPNLTLQICARAAKEGLPVYFYGSTPKTVEALQPALERKFPGLVVAGVEPSKFRHLTCEEKTELSSRIRNSGAALVFVGLGCPRQEVFAYEFRGLLAVPVLAVGAAFSFLAGTLPQAPAWMQNVGLEWFYRLLSEPRRLWRRYLFLNPAYLFLVALQAIGLSKFSSRGRPPTRELLYG